MEILNRNIKESYDEIANFFERTSVVATAIPTGINPDNFISDYSFTNRVTAIGNFFVGNTCASLNN